MCEYCNGHKNLLNRNDRLSSKGDFFPGIDMYIDDGILQIDVKPDTYEPSFMEESIKIHYCPMCGKKLIDKKGN